MDGSKEVAVVEEEEESPMDDDPEGPVGKVALIDVEDGEDDVVAVAVSNEGERFVIGLNGRDGSGSGPFIC